MSPSVEEIKEILNIFLDSELQELRLEIGSVRLAVAKSGAAGSMPAFAPAPRPAAAALAAEPAPAPAAAPQAAAPAAPATEPVASKAAAQPAAGARAAWVMVTAPSVGTFYRRPAPDQPPFVQVGSEVKQNDPLCLIEVMKMFTGVPAPCAGRVAEILIEDATVVEYGQPLMYIEPT